MIVNFKDRETAFVAGGVYASAGRTEMPAMSKSVITTDRLPNPYPGVGLREDLFDPLDLSPEAVAVATGLDASTINRFLEGDLHVDADFDLRLGRYFGFSEGFFMRLQVAHDLEESRLRLADDLARIGPVHREAA